MFITTIVSTTVGIADREEDEQTTVIMCAHDIHDMNVRNLDELRMTLLDIKPDHCTILWDTFQHDDRDNSGSVKFLFKCSERSCNVDHSSSFAWWYSPDEDLHLTGEYPAKQVMTMQHVDDFMSRIDLGVCPSTLLADQIAEIGPDLHTGQINDANVDSLIAAGWFDMFGTIDDGLLALGLTKDLNVFAFNRIIALAAIACHDKKIMAEILAPQPDR